MNLEKKSAEPEQPDFASQLKNRLKKKGSDGPSDSTPNLEIGSSWKKKQDTSEHVQNEHKVEATPTPAWKRKPSTKNVEPIGKF